MEEREKLKSRLGFILLSAGCAIGIGNVWKFHTLPDRAEAVPLCCFICCF